MPTPSPQNLIFPISTTRKPLQNDRAHFSRRYINSGASLLGRLPVCLLRRLPVWLLGRLPECLIVLPPAGLTTCLPDYPFLFDCPAAPVSLPACSSACTGLSGVCLHVWLPVFLHVHPRLPPPAWRLVGRSNNCARRQTRKANKRSARSHEDVDPDYVVCGDWKRQA